MIIAFDGNVFVGKTTLCKTYARENKGQVINEHSHFIDLLKKNDSVPSKFSSHYRYLLADALRMKTIAGKKIFLDRSFVSTSAHIYALYKTKEADFREKHLFYLEKFLQEQAIIIPDVFIFVICEHDIAQERFLQDHFYIKPKNTAPRYINHDYYQAVEEFNFLWQENLDCGRIVINGRGCVPSFPLRDETDIFIGNKRIGIEEIMAKTKKIYHPSISSSL